MKLKYPTHFIGITKGYKPTHLAIDLGWNNKYGGKNAPVYACECGKVTSIRDGRNNSMKPGDSGNYVTVKYADGYETRVCHLEKNSIRVKKGDVVTEDTILGLMGNSGYCGKDKGYHVHFIVWHNGVRVNPTKHVYVYPDEVVANSTKKEYPNLLYYDNEPEPTPTKKYIEITAKSGVWCRKGIGFKYSKYKVIPYKTKCELVKKNAGKANGYTWDEIVFEKENVYIPNKWNKYL